MEKTEPSPSISLKEQLQSLKNRKIILIHLTSFLFLTGHLTLYAYLTPFLQTTLSINGNWLSVTLLIFGVAAIIGGCLGGFLSDRFGPRKTIIGVITVFALSIFAIPFTTKFLPVFIVVMMIWSMLSWAITPAIQSYLIASAPETSDIQQSINNSALHFGIAFGSMIGGIVIERAGVEVNPITDGGFALLAPLVMSLSMIKNQEIQKKY